MSSVRAYCPVCDRLVPIESRGNRPDRRQQYWQVMKHPAIDDDTGGRDCDGTGRTV